MKLIRSGLARGELRFNAQCGTKGLNIAAKKSNWDISILFNSHDGAEGELQPSSHLLWCNASSFTQLPEGLAYDMPGVSRSELNGSDDLAGLCHGVFFSHGSKVTEPPIPGNAHLSLGLKGRRSGVFSMIQVGVVTIR